MVQYIIHVALNICCVNGILLSKMVIDTKLELGLKLSLLQLGQDIVLGLDDNTNPI